MPICKQPVIPTHSYYLGTDFYLYEYTYRYVYICLCVFICVLVNVYI